eukprot:4659316-Amphidinium_carterae.1
MYAPEPVSGVERKCGGREQVEDCPKSLKDAVSVFHASLKVKKIHEVINRIPYKVVCSCVLDALPARSAAATRPDSARETISASLALV